MKIAAITVIVFANQVNGFGVVHLHRLSSLVVRSKASTATQATTTTTTTRFLSNDDDSNSNDAAPKENPYADPNYPDLEFVNYDDPEYESDFGDEFTAAKTESTTDEMVEEMREDRRQRNDEYQFETYFTQVLKNGDEFKGEWTVYKTTTFMDDVDKKQDDNGMPRLRKAKQPLRVISKGYKIQVPNETGRRVDANKICHEEVVAVAAETNSQEWKDDVDTDEGFGRSRDDENVNEAERCATKKEQEEIMANVYWPKELASFDFRGPQGNMVVGDAYTICMGVPLQPTNQDTPQEAHEGPFSEMRTEVGIHSNQLRFRVKFDYSILPQEQQQVVQHPPRLHLKSMTVCRELRNEWPKTPGSSKLRSLSDRASSEALFSGSGADGGLYDPPPVGEQEQAQQYMMVDLEGCATVLFPHVIDQDPNAFEGNGWVTSLDWTPAGPNRFQVDRKVKGGTDLLGLRTLELSEVQRATADDWRPTDGGEDMRQ